MVKFYSPGGVNIDASLLKWIWCWCCCCFGLLKELFLCDDDLFWVFFFFFAGFIFDSTIAMSSWCWFVIGSVVCVFLFVVFDFVCWSFSDCFVFRYFAIYHYCWKYFTMDCLLSFQEGLCFRLFLHKMEVITFLWEVLHATLVFRLLCVLFFVVCMLSSHKQLLANYEFLVGH